MSERERRPRYRMDRSASNLRYQRESQIVVRMRPDRFLSHTPQPPGRRYDEGSLSDLKGKISRGVQLDPLFLDVEPSGRVVGHEGRHRAEAARELRVKRVPVIIFFRGEGGRGFVERPKKPTRIWGRG
jgi:hypothetical protein